MMNFNNNKKKNKKRHPNPGQLLFENFISYEK